MSIPNEIYTLLPGQRVNVIVKETGQPIRYNRPLTVQKTGVYCNVLTVYAKDAEGDTWVFPQSKFRFVGLTAKV